VHVERRRPSRPQAYPPGAPRQGRWRWISTAALVVMAVGVLLLVVAAFGAVR
jgi:hypothetical protein